ncbi:MAG: PRC-barrel domain-containing protein [Gemmatimonadetes bacterium]|nr:PRC-barrel domain-containing protein [Gemmatimonadota bacterium]MCC6771712.1 PRC-barrel domain-containing protein [Gemmatimonadaceae bacterium]
MTNTTNKTDTATTATSTTSNVTASTLVSGKDVKAFNITPPMVDVRGWDVVNSTGAVVGTVDRIMLDTNDHKPRYLAVTPSDRKGHMLLPIGVGTLELAHKRIMLANLKPDMLKALPLLTSEVVTRDFERQVFSAISGKPVTEQALPQLYADPMFDATRLFVVATPVAKS